MAGASTANVADRKPPLVPFLYGASFWLTGSRDLRPLHVFAALEVAAAALILAWEARARAGARAGCGAAGLLIAGAIAPCHGCVGGELLAPRAGPRPAPRSVPAWRGTARSAAAAGVWLGLAVLTRQTWIIGVVPVAFAARADGGRRGERALALVGTMTLTILAIGIVVPFGGFFEWTFTSNGSLLFDLTQSHNVLPRALSAVELFLVGHFVLCWLARAADGDATKIHLWLWLLTGLVAVGAGFRFFGHYWLQVLPPLCLLAAPAVARSTLSGARRAGRRRAPADDVVLDAGAHAPGTRETRCRSSPKCARTRLRTSESRCGGRSRRSTGSRDGHPWAPARAQRLPGRQDG